MPKTSVSSPRGKRAAANVRPTPRHRPDAEIDFSDMPELTPAQLRAGRRVSDLPALTPAQLRGMRRGRPLDGDYAKQMIAIRLAPALLAQLRDEAKRRGMGYQTLMHEL